MIEKVSGGLKPAVTVLVRSMDRLGLGRAVQSALDQEAVAVQVVVVVAHGGRLAQTGPWRADSRVRVVESGRRLPRSAAANACLTQVCGGLALFLDDDDWLLPGHLGGLSAALTANPSAAAAYTGVRCLTGEPSAPREVQVFDSEVSWVAMQLQNLLPIHAVIFRAEAVIGPNPCRFDEGLEHFEDWDFWLQMMARGPFVRVPGVTAVYWLDPQAGSGHTAEGEVRQDRLARFGERQLRRWSPKDVVGLIERNGEQIQRIEVLGQQVAEHEGTIERLHRLVETRTIERDRADAEVVRLAGELEAHRREVATLTALRHEHLSQIDRLNAQVASLLASTSWRVTRPLRAAGATVAFIRGGRLAAATAQAGRLIRASIRRHGLLGMLWRVPRYVWSAPRYLRELTGMGIAAQYTFAATGQSSVPVRLHPEIAGTDELIDARVSVVIPTLNAGNDLVWLLRKLAGQRAVREIEVVVVDSGSTDGSPERARAAGARVVTIPPSEFTHSHARNLGADHASGDYLVFMVQDAYPIGDLWLYGLVRYLLDHREEGVVAASCAEYSRSDSDAMYDCMVNTHYRFLGCLEHDRIGRHVGDDHMSLRAMGQLSDVSCLIPRELFMRYRYRGDYAEDLDLGIRLLRDGHRLAMLASVKVIHSHNRPAYYYLKRSFVDVVFLVGLFEDFQCPPCRSVAGLLDGVKVVAQKVSAWLPVLLALPDGEDLPGALSRWLAAARQWPLTPSGATWSLGDEKLEGFVDGLVAEGAALGTGGASPAAASQETRQFIDGFIARVDHFHQFASQVYGQGDERLRREFADAVRKTFAATLGASVAYLVLDRRHGAGDLAEQRWAEGLFNQLKAGV